MYAPDVCKRPDIRGGGGGGGGAGGCGGAGAGGSGSDDIVDGEHVRTDEDPEYVLFEYCGVTDSSASKTDSSAVDEMRVCAMERSSSTRIVIDSCHNEGGRG